MPNNKEKCCEGCLRIQPDGFHGCCDITCPCHRPAHSTGLAESMIVQKGGGNEHSVEVRGNFEEPSGAKGGRVIRPGETEKNLSTLSTEATKYNDFRKIPDNEVEEPQGESWKVVWRRDYYPYVDMEGLVENLPDFEAFIENLLSQTKREAREEGMKFGYQAAKDGLPLPQKITQEDAEALKVLVRKNADIINGRNEKI